jgi:hypothetical protein
LQKNIEDEKGVTAQAGAHAAPYWRKTGRAIVNRSWASFDRRVAPF